MNILRWGEGLRILVGTASLGLSRSLLLLAERVGNEKSVEWLSGWMSEEEGRKEGKIQLLKGFHTHADSKPVRLQGRCYCAHLREEN